jgi:hypothetical protein
MRGPLRGSQGLLTGRHAGGLQETENALAEEQPYKTQTDNAAKVWKGDERGRKHGHEGRKNRVLSNAEGERSAGTDKGDYRRAQQTEGYDENDTRWETFRGQVVRGIAFQRYHDMHHVQERTATTEMKVLYGKMRMLGERMLEEMDAVRDGRSPQGGVKVKDRWDIVEGTRKYWDNKGRGGPEKGGFKTLLLKCEGDVSWWATADWRGIFAKIAAEGGGEGGKAMKKGKGGRQDCGTESGDRGKPMREGSPAQKKGADKMSEEVPCEGGVSVGGEEEAQAASQDPCSLSSECLAAIFRLEAVGKALESVYGINQIGSFNKSAEVLEICKRIRENMDYDGLHDEMKLSTDLFWYISKRIELCSNQPEKIQILLDIILASMGIEFDLYDYKADPDCTPAISETYASRVVFFMFRRCVNLMGLNVHKISTIQKILFHACFQSQGPQPREGAKLGLCVRPVVSCISQGPLGLRGRPC